MGEIVIQPLDSERVRAYLQGDEYIALRQLIDENSIIREDFARIPFMVNTMAYVTRGKSIEALHLSLAEENNAYHLRTIFLADYVTQRLSEYPVPDSTYTDVYQTRLWLRWLARQLISHDQTDFYLENMQPDWLDNILQLRNWKLLYIVSYGLLFVLVVGILTDMIGGVLIILLLVIVVMLVNRELSLLGNKQSNNIIVHEHIQWAFDRQKIEREIVFGLVITLAFTVTNGMRGLVLGIIYTFMYVLAGEVSRIETEPMLSYRIIPNQGIQRSLRNGLIDMLLTTFSMSILFIFPSLMLQKQPLELRNLLLLLIPLGISVALNRGLGTFIQHYALRIILAQSGYIPYFHYVRFLNYANDRILLRKVGGGYRFIHDYLRQHLAGKT